jgi:Rrf2 family transcriptional regulator, cysteine metabolism repressor
MFSVSTKGRYAARAMLELALHDGDSPAQLAEISASQGISLKYLSRIMSSLVAAGLVASRRGKKGGFILVRPPESILVLDVLRAVEGPIEPSPCIGRMGNCNRTSQCATRQVWLKVADSLTSVLAGISLGDLVRQHQNIRMVPDESDYAI